MTLICEEVTMLDDWVGVGGGGCVGLGCEECRCIVRPAQGDQGGIVGRRWPGSQSLPGTEATSHWWAWVKERKDLKVASG